MNLLEITSYYEPTRVTKRLLLDYAVYRVAISVSVVKATLEQGVSLDINIRLMKIGTKKLFYFELSLISVLD